MSELFRVRSPDPSTLLTRTGAQRDGTEWLVTPKGREFLLRRGGRTLRRQVQLARPFVLDAQTQSELEGRLFASTMASRFSDPLPEEVRLEALVRLAADPRQRLEYVGRGEAVRYDAEASSLETLDVPGGRRRYRFRRLDHHEPAPSMSAMFERELKSLHDWLDAPDAKKILSIGGGGYRAFAVTPILRMLDLVLEDRTQIDEVWGCSGGAIAAHIFADGHDPAALDELAYSIYHQHDLGLEDFSVPSVARLWWAARKDRTNAPTIQQHWLRRLEQIEPHADRRPSRVPFYAVSANPGQRRLYALTDPEVARGDDMDFVLGTERSKGLAATAAVPMIFPSLRGITGLSEGDVWVDGGLLDENPLALPFAKWARELSRGSARPKLKVLLIDLNARASESRLATMLAQTPGIGRLGFKRIFRQLDMLLDSRSDLTMEMISEMPMVQVFHVKLSINAFAVRDRGSVLKAVLGGRNFRNWELRMVGGGDKVSLR